MRQSNSIESLNLEVYVSKKMEESAKDILIFISNSQSKFVETMTRMFKTSFIL
jgi:hypothetical protein